MRHPNLWIVQYFLNELNIEVDACDYKMRTPFSIGIDFQIRRSLTVMDPAVNLLLDRGVNIDAASASTTPSMQDWRRASLKIGIARPSLEHAQQFSNISEVRGAFRCLLAF